VQPFGLTDKVGFKLFFWLMSGVAAAMIGITTYIYAVDRQLGTSMIELKVLQSDTRHISEMVNKIDRKVDRLPQKMRTNGDGLSP
jgi:hypothetical protein